MQKNTAILYLSIICSLLIGTLAKANHFNPSLLSEIRDQLPQAFENAATCETLYQKTLKETAIDPILQGYIGAIHLAKSRHVSIFKKMGFFNKGIDLLEKSIAAAPNEVELHFLRLTIQLNLPGFLNYYGNIKQDKEFVLTNYKKAPANMQVRIVDFVKTSGHFSAAEINRV